MLPINFFNNNINPICTPTVGAGAGAGAGANFISSWHSGTTSPLTRAMQRVFNYSFSRKT
jgi:hypothetical protein